MKYLLRSLAIVLCLAPLALGAQEAAPSAASALNPNAPNPAPARPELRPVFEAFGGKPGLTLLMDDFMTLLLADPRTGPFFADREIDRIKLHLTEQFCVILGGDCSYGGMDMITAHVDSAISHADFNALVEVLQIAMERRHIPTRAQNQLLAHLAPMHREIINN